MAQPEKGPSYLEAPRQASVSAPGLASDDDAAVLGKHVQHESMTAWTLTLLHSKTGVQARAAAKFHYDRGLWYSFFHHGSSSLNCVNLDVFNPRRPRWDGLGQ